MTRVDATSHISGSAVHDEIMVSSPRSLAVILLTTYLFVAAIASQTYPPVVLLTLSYHGCNVTINCTVSSQFGFLTVSLAYCDTVLSNSYENIDDGPSTLSVINITTVQNDTRILCVGYNGKSSQSTVVVSNPNCNLSNRCVAGTTSPTDFFNLSSITISGKNTTTHADVYVSALVLSFMLFFILLYTSARFQWLIPPWMCCYVSRRGVYNLVGRQRAVSFNPYV
uniref:GP121.2 n=1 Tax=Caviid herpesvirus 2 str. CIDMTR TaxID=1415526 RepID=U6HA00_9BETA|nr:GP121.2 [Caviid herpesvirus 2 str. CIDMTR]